MKNYGFTLLELIITIALAAILLTLAVPNMRDFIQNNRMSGQANEVVTALNLARSEALKRSRQVGVCASDDGETCSTSDPDWSDGWVVFNAADDASIRTFISDGERSALVNTTPTGTTVFFAGNGTFASNVNNSAHGTCPDAYCLALCERASGETSQCAAPRCRGGQDLTFRRIHVSRTGNVSMEYRSC